MPPALDDHSTGAPADDSGGEGNDSAASSGYLSCVSFGVSSSAASTTASLPSPSSSSSSLLDGVAMEGGVVPTSSADLLALSPLAEVPALPVPADAAAAAAPLAAMTAADATPDEAPPPPVVSDVNFGLRDSPPAGAVGAGVAAAAAARTTPLASSRPPQVTNANSSPTTGGPPPITLPALLMFNPASGRSCGVGLEETLLALTAAGLRGVVALPTSPGRDTAGATAAALRDRGPFGVVIAAGGDGTVSAVAAGLLAHTGVWKGSSAEAVAGARGGDGADSPHGSPRHSGAPPSRVPLAIIPRGTANVLAAALSLPNSLEGAAAAAAAAAAVTSAGMADEAAAVGAAVTNATTVAIPAGGAGRDAAPPATIPGGVRALDVGTANGRPFLLLTGIGLESDEVAGARRSLKARIGTLAYVASSLSLGMAHTPWAFTYTVTAADGANAAGAVRAATAVTVANTAPWTPVMAAAEAADPAAPRGTLGSVGGVPDDGALDATAFTASAGGAPATAAAVVGVGLPACAGTTPPKHVHTARVVRLTVVADPPQRVVVDGEEAGTTPVDFAVLPAALLVAGVGAAPPPGPLATAAAGVSAALGVTVGGVSKAVGGVVGGVVAATRGVGGRLMAVGGKLTGGGAGAGSPTAVSAATAEAVWVPEGGEDTL